MGHTVWSARVAVDSLVSELNDYAKALSPKDRELFQELLKDSYQHISKISYASSMHLWAFFLLSIMLEQEKKNKKN